MSEKQEKKLEPFLYIGIISVIVILSLFVVPALNDDVKQSEFVSEKINIFYGDWYCETQFVSFRAGKPFVYEIQDFDFQTNFLNELDSLGIKYNISYDVWCDGQEEIIIKLPEPIKLTVSWTMYDRLLAGNEPTYSETRVIEGFEIW